MTRRLTRRLIGTAFIGLLCFLLWLTYAFYAKIFTDTVDVELKTSHIGLQLNPHADVKLRGIIVGHELLVFLFDRVGGGGLSVIVPTPWPSPIVTLTGDDRLKVNVSSVGS